MTDPAYEPAEPAGTARPVAAPDPVRLVVVDDEPLVRQGLSLILGAEDDLEIVGEAADGDEALRIVRATRPHVV
ncbi:response regulator transcription factor [Brachybacterium paraconglomeratum]|uniref:response regulator transcription factor n=1 Tax=Brachybacterium paraconglomeratum TaxID=173362 RepID=UPI003FCEFDD1